MESPFINALTGLMTPTAQVSAAVESQPSESKPAAKRVFCCLCQDPVGIVKENSMEQAYCIAAVWLALAVVSTILANHLRVSTALLEICVGITAGAVAEHFWDPDSLGANVEWLRFLASTGAVLLTFLAGAELDPAIFKAKWKEATVIGMVGFFAPFLGCAALAKYA